MLTFTSRAPIPNTHAVKIYAHRFDDIVNWSPMMMAVLHKNMTEISIFTAHSTFVFPGGKLFFMYGVRILGNFTFSHRQYFCTSNMCGPIIMFDFGNWNVSVELNCNLTRCLHCVWMVRKVLKIHKYSSIKFHYLHMILILCVLYFKSLWIRFGNIWITAK